MREEQLTQEGYDNLCSQLQDLRTTGRARIAEEIKRAREFGDISENAEYDAAKHEQGLLEKKIAELEHRLSRARVIKAGERSSDGRPSLGSTVNFKVEKGRGEGSSHKMILCSSLEANAAEGKLSVESPIGAALMRARVGESVEVAAPSGRTTLKLTKIS